VTEKNYGVKLAEASLCDIESARSVLSPADYRQLHGCFERTLLTARLHRATAAAYFGFRVWSRGGSFRTSYVQNTTQAGLTELQEVEGAIRNYPGHVPTGQWDWRKDADEADRYFHWIVTDGWPEDTLGVANPAAGMKFPYVGP